MYEDMLRRKIIIELKKLVEKVEDSTNDVDSYGEFMREMILNTYSEN